jgi:hypothetical protein
MSVSIWPPAAPPQSMGGGANAENQPQVFKLLRATFRVNAGTT